MVVILAVLGIQFLGGSGGPESTGAADTTGAAITSAPEQTSAAGNSAEPSTTTSARTSTTTTTTSATTTTRRPDLPTGAQPCSGSAPGGSEYGSAATGTAVTSCEFAEAVRQAYLDPTVVSAEGDPVSVEATSPVTGQAYTLECVAADGVVTCRGGNNAVVYLY
ncbi:hypothetical protein [Nocardia rhamnosiphila]|uniref:hypothetical protein n=1 Tax=Nocardia rhamnosiphila TaxID=426716 RepID=UPI0012DCF69A|nr:hypothetical protein [Nocardia rhamnosiphila]